MPSEEPAVTPEFEPIGAQEFAELVNGLSRRWTEMAQSFEAETGLRAVQAEVHLDSVPEAILTYAGTHGIDLIVMGTHARTGVDRLLLGSVAEEVVRQAACPVLTVQKRASMPHRDVRRILAPLALSGSRGPMVRQAVDLAKAYEAKLDLLHVITPPLLPLPFRDETDDEVERARCRDAMKALLRQNGGEAVQAELHVMTGPLVPCIVDFANRHEVDVIVMATQGRSGLERFMLGSVTEQVVRQAPCPVFAAQLHRPGEAVPASLSGISLV